MDVIKLAVLQDFLVPLKNVYKKKKNLTDIIISHEIRE